MDEMQKLRITDPKSGQSLVIQVPKGANPSPDDIDEIFAKHSSGLGSALQPLAAHASTLPPDFNSLPTVPQPAVKDKSFLTALGNTAKDVAVGANSVRQSIENNYVVPWRPAPEQVFAPGGVERLKNTLNLAPTAAVAIGSGGTMSPFAAAAARTAGAYGLGFASDFLGRTLGNNIEGKPNDLGQNAIEANKYASASGLGQAIGEALPLLGNATTSAAKKLYGSTAKIPTTVGLPERNALIEGLMKERIAATPGGADKLSGLVNDINSSIDADIRNAVQSTPGGINVDRKDLLGNVADVKDRVGNTVTPSTNLKQVNDVVKDFMGTAKKPNPPIGLEDLQDLKKNTYQVLQNDFGSLSNANKETQKAIVRAAKDKIAELVPSVIPQNARESLLLQAEPFIERAAGRVASRDIFGLGSKVIGAGVGATTGNLADATGAAIAHAIFSNPWVKSQLSFMMAGVGKAMAQPVSTAVPAWLVRQTQK